MIFKQLTLIGVFGFSIYSPGVLADQDMRELLIELTSQIRELKTELKKSNARIDELEQKLEKSAQTQTTTVSPPIAQTQTTPSPSAVSPQTLAGAPTEKEPKPAVSAGDVKGTIKIPGTDTSIGVGGYVKLDALYSSTSMGENKYGNQRLEPSEIPVKPLGKGNEDQLTLHAKESRFWLKSFTPSSWGDMNTYVEIDFFGDPGAYTYTPRLRHAYGSLGNFLAGQTWSTFLNSQALADTLDNNTSVGSLLTLRQPQVRWTQPFTIEHLPMEWQASLEAPRSRIWDVSSNNPMTTVTSSHYPDMVARLNFYPSWGNLSLAALGRQVQYAPDSNTPEQSVWGGAISAAGKISTSGSDNLRFMLNYGNGMGRYDENNFFADATFDAQGNIHLITSYSGMLAYQHWWNKAWRSNVEYGIAHADQPGFAGLANQQTQSVHANLLWSPITQTTIGLEYIYANRELVNQQDGELHRLQFSTRFNF